MSISADCFGFGLFLGDSTTYSEDCLSIRYWSISLNLSSMIFCSFNLFLKLSPCKRSSVPALTSESSASWSASADLWTFKRVDVFVTGCFLLKTISSFAILDVFYSGVLSCEIGFLGNWGVMVSSKSSSWSFWNIFLNFEYFSADSCV